MAISSTASVEHVNSNRRPFVVGLAVSLMFQIVFASLLVVNAGGKAPQAPITIAVVGGSYTAGVQNRVVWPDLLAARTGWSVANFALPDAGYVADGLGGQAFSYQVDRAQSVHPRAIVIVGGIADTGLPPYTDAISVGAREAINKIKLSGKQALVVGPTWYEIPVPDAVRRVSEATDKVAHEAGVPFLDALDPPWLTSGEMRSDLSGPTDIGQSLIADRIATWLRAQVAG
jgi:hypothetical protein